MPYVVTKARYPSYQANEVAKRGIEVIKQFPPDKTLGDRLLPLAVYTSNKGIKYMVVTEIKAGKLEEALTRAGKSQAMFLGIEGYESTTEVWSTASEAYSTINMKSPIE